MEFLVVFDFDATLIKTTLPDVGKGMWSSHHGIEYPHVGWWGRKESLDSDVFDTASEGGSECDGLFDDLFDDEFD